MKFISKISIQVVRKSHIIATLVMAISLNMVIPFVQINSAQAQSGSPSGTGNEVVCRNASRDYSTFLSAVMSYDDFGEYWKDIFVRYNANPCLYLDIDNLMHRIEKARAQVRSAFFACDAQSQKIKTNYYQLEAELFFLRKYIQVGNGQLYVKNEQEVYNDLRNHFVINKGFFSEEQTKKLFETFKARYQSRFATYQNCKDADWQDLVGKWNELKENVTSGFGAKEAADSIGHKWARVINAPLKRTGNLLFGFLDVNLNMVDGFQSLSDIQKKLQKNLPTSLTFEQLQAGADQENSRYEDDIAKAEYLTQYEYLYKEGSGESVNNISEKIQSLEQTIRGTFPYINQTYECTKGILDRAC